MSKHQDSTPDHSRLLVASDLEELDSPAPATPPSHQPHQEWLVSDRTGAFAMGTASGVRTRKYHGYYLGIPGRAQTAFLTDLEIRLGAHSLWPHRYAGSREAGLAGFVEHPPTAQFSVRFEALPHPQWTWRLPEGTLSFSVESGQAGGIRLGWEWAPKRAYADQEVELRVRPFCAMRDLHAVGGQSWTWQPNAETRAGEKRVRLTEATGKVLHLALEKDWQFEETPIWHHNFLYTEELERGYPATEDLHSAGEAVCRLRGPQAVGWVLAQELRHLDAFTPERGKRRRAATLDFELIQPAGVVAGFPWFGEWGRDTFIALPGIVAARLAEGSEPTEILNWVRQVLERWGRSIPTAGSLPNLIDRDGTQQWESADATLWWVHALAALWQMSLGEASFLALIKHDFAALLGHAIQAIQQGRHRFLREIVDGPDAGLLGVTSPHTTWMDARIDGQAVTPRIGVLPEINALWFQARVLLALWTPETSALEWQELELLGRQALQIPESDRPNRIFLHSIPLAPSFVLQDGATLNSDLERFRATLWTPFGLRTLAPTHPDYRGHCVGTQRERDLAYHQGTVWGWLGGHYEMARARTKRQTRPETFPAEQMAEMPIPAHFPEIFDADAPFTPRGAPAQAWSIACWEEAQGRRRMRLDPKLSQTVNARWLRKKAAPQRADEGKPLR